MGPCGIAKTTEPHKIQKNQIIPNLKKTNTFIHIYIYISWGVPPQYKWQIKVYRDPRSLKHVFLPVVIGILDRGREHFSIHLEIHTSNSFINNSTPQKTMQNHDLIETQPTQYSRLRIEPPRDKCLEAVHLVERLDCQKGWVDTPRHHESDLPPIRETKHIWCIGVWLICGIFRCYLVFFLDLQ